MSPVVFRLRVNFGIAIDLCTCINFRSFKATNKIINSPEVLVNKNRALVLFASPSMFIVPKTEVLMVFVELYW